MMEFTSTIWEALKWQIGEAGAMAASGSDDAADRIVKAIKESNRQRELQHEEILRKLDR